MRTIALIFFLPYSLVYANCGCDDVYKEIARERQEDTKYHVLTATDTCTDTRCAEARCAGTAKLAFDKTIVNKMRCNNSQWIVGEKEAKAVICAKSCNTGACKASHPRASADFKPLKVLPSDAENRCSRGVCEPDNGLVALNADGSLQLPLKGVVEVECTGDGVWRNAGAYVMCNASPCGPARCAGFVAGPGMSNGAVVPLTVIGHGSQCATATCDYGYVLMNRDGDVAFEVPDDSLTLLTCQADTGNWLANTAATFPLVMCKPKPNCQDMTKFPLIDCNAINNPKGYKCTDAVISPTLVSCPIPGSMMYIVAINRGSSAGTFTCKGTQWWHSNGKTLNELVGASTAQVACMSPSTP